MCDHAQRRPYDKMTDSRTIAVFNHKGGVGKTTTAVNLAAVLALNHGARCLVVDMDPQANATMALLGRDLDPERWSMKHVLLQEGERSISVGEVLTRTAIPGLNIAPADLSLSETEFKLVSKMGRESVLREALRTVASSFDYVVIDCPPSLGLLSLNALAAADGVVIPSETQFLSLRGLRYVLDVLDLVRAKLNPDLRILGVLATKYYVLSRANNETLECLRGLKQVHLFDAVIPRDVKAEEAPSHGEALVSYAPESRAAKQYASFAKEVITLCQQD